ncbi:MAG TPA: hypothetical protein VIW46_00275 [Acidimicrobiia bacterium]
MTEVRITGGADEYQAAAVIAVIQHVEGETAAVRRPQNPNAQSAWLRKGRYGPLGRFRPPIDPDPGLNWAER